MAFELFLKKSGITFALHSHTYRIEYNLFKNFIANFIAESDETRSKREGGVAIKIMICVNEHLVDDSYMWSAWDFYSYKYKCCRVNTFL